MDNTSLAYTGPLKHGLFSINTYCSTTQSSAESPYAEPRVQRKDYKTLEAPDPHVVQVSNVPPGILTDKSWIYSNSTPLLFNCCVQLLCNPINCGPSGSSVQDVPGKNTGVGCHLSGDLPYPGIEPRSPAVAVRFFTTEPPRKPIAPSNFSIKLIQLYNFYYFIPDWKPLDKKELYFTLIHSI